MWFLNIEELDNGNDHGNDDNRSHQDDASEDQYVDLSKIKVDKWLDGGVLGPASISHHIYDPTGKYILVTTYRIGSSEGELLVLNAETNQVERILTMPARPHSLAYPGWNR